MGPLSYQQRMFVEFYLGESEGSAADAARRAGYRCPETLGPRLVKRSAIRAAIDADPRGDWKVDLKQVKRLGLGHLIKRLRKNKDGSSEIELEARVPALLKLGDHYKLWKGEAQSQLTLVELAKGLSEQYDQLQREERADKTAESLSGPTGPVQ